MNVLELSEEMDILNKDTLATGSKNSEILKLPIILIPFFYFNIVIAD